MDEGVENVEGCMDEVKSMLNRIYGDFGLEILGCPNAMKIFRERLGEVDPEELDLLYRIARYYGCRIFVDVVEFRHIRQMAVSLSFSEVEGKDMFDYMGRLDNTLVKSSFEDTFGMAVSVALSRYVDFNEDVGREYLAKFGRGGFPFLKVGSIPELVINLDMNGIGSLRDGSVE